MKLTEVNYDPFAASPIEHAISAEGVSPQVADIARSIYHQESSSGKNTTTSNAGAVGGMQIIPDTFNRMADKGWSIDNPDHNARAGVRYISMLNDKAGGDPALTAAGYYGGEGAIKKAQQGIAVSDPKNPNAPNTLQYGQQVASRIPAKTETHKMSLQEVNYDPFSQDELKTGTGTRYTQSQLSQAKNPPTFTQDLQTEIANNPIKAKMAAAGTALTDMYNGGKQLLGMDSPQVRTDIRDQKTISDANKGSSFAGNAALYALGGLAPALNTVKGAAIGGAAIGAIAPTEQDSVLQGKLGSTLVGAGTGAAGAKIGQALVNSLANKTAAAALAKSQNTNADANVKSAIDAGYKITPTYAGGSNIATALEGISGKFKTQELAGIKNQSVTDKLARSGLGLPENASISEAAINDLKVPHNAVYKEASSLPSGVVGQSTTKSLATGKDVTTDIVKSGDQLVSDWKEASDSARAAYKAANSPLSPNPNEMRSQAKEFSAKADSLQNQIQTLAETNGKSDLVDRLKDARKNLARIYTYEDALNPETSHIDAKQIGKALQKGKPLDENATTIGKFANGFGDLAKVPKVREASPITPLDVISSALTGGLAPIARLGSRAAVLSPLMQKSLANKSYDVGVLPKALSTLRYAPMAVAGSAVKALSK